MKHTNDPTLQYPFSYRDAVEILKLVEDTAHCQSLELRIGDISVSMTRKGEAVAASAAPATAAPAPAAAAVTAPEAPRAAEAPTAAPAATAAAGGANETKIITPTLGVFYRCPSPGAEPFVKEGDHVNPDDQIGLLEVMKLYMPVTAGVSGRITKILASDGELVEHDQALMLIEND